MRALLVGFAAFLLRVFFRRIQVEHAERLPKDGPVIYVLNHPNGLVDPLFILAFAGRPVSFLAKEPLFHMPFLGWALRRLDALPVYRSKDGADTKQNARMFADARALLRRGGSIALFPEGTSHSDPRLKPLKTGAARIALGAAATEGEATAAATEGAAAPLPLRIVPVGLSYSAKQTFRSEALVCVGEPFDVPHVELAPAGEVSAEPAVEAVHALTDRIAEALADLTLQADRVETLRAVELARRLFAAEGDAGSADLARALELRRRIAGAEAAARARRPELVRAVTARVLAHADALAGLGIPEHQLVPPRLTLAFVLRRLAVTLAFLPVSLAALAGAALNFVPYRLTGFIARRAIHVEEDVLATAKILAATALYPLTWIVLAGAAAAWRGPWVGATMLAASPVLGFIALRYRERLRGLLASLRAVRLWLFRRAAFTELIEERRALRELMGQIEASLASPQ